MEDFTLVMGNEESKAINICALGASQPFIYSIKLEVYKVNNATLKLTSQLRKQDEQPLLLFSSRRCPSLIGPLEFDFSNFN